MKIHLIIILSLVYTTIIGIRKRNNKELIISQDSGKIHEYSNNLNHSIVNNLNSYNVVHLDQNHCNYKKKRDSNDSIEDLLKFLDSVNIFESSTEELNKCAPVAFDYNSLNELLEDKQDFKSMNEKKMGENDVLNSEEYVLNNREEFVIVLTEDNINKNVDKCKFVDSFLEINKDYSNLELKETEEVKSMWDTFKTYIKVYITEHIPYSHRNKYIRRLEKIEEICSIFDNNKLDCKKYLSIFSPSQDEKLIEELKEIISIFGECSKFNQKTCNEFLLEFDSKIFYSSNSKEIRSKLSLLVYNQKYLFFSYEFIKLYRYVREIPELLTLGGCYSTKTYWDIILIVHIINVFVDNVKNIENNNFFVLCMIVKTFECFYWGKFELFKILDFKLESNKCSHNLYYFTWDFNNAKRFEVSNRQNEGLKMMFNDVNYLMSVFLTYLYQTRIINKYCKFDAEGIKLFKELISKVKKSENCVGCLFNEYLSIIC